MKRLLTSLLATVLAFGLGGCLHDDDDDPVVTPTAQLRVLHGSPDAPNVDVLVNGDIVLEDVPYKGASGYLDVPTTGFDVAVNATGTDTTALALDNVELTPDTPYTVIAANSLASIEAIVLDDSVTAPAAGNLAVRVVHGAATAPAVDVYVTAADADLGAASPAVSNAAFADASGFLEIAAGEYRIRVTATGTTDVVFDSGAIDLPEGAQLTVVALPSENPVSPIELVALTGDSAAPTIELNDNRALLRAAHMSPDAPNVDVYVDGAQVLTNVPFKAVSDYLTVPSGTTNVQVTATGTTTPVIDVDLELAATSATSAIAVDFVASIEAIAPMDDLSEPAAGDAHVRVVHASPDAPNVDVLVDDAIVLTDVPFKAVSDYLPLAAGSHNIKVNATGTSTTVIDVTLDFADGAIYTVFAANSLANIEAVRVQDN
ncbi:MAG: DUF4397 domain-containing protein [Gammaproteobacteria bacterium]|nr:DUF4397 domain-containing protein [Gammaproteobacteria bacterium]